MEIALVSLLIKKCQRCIFWTVPILLALFRSVVQLQEKDVCSLKV